MVVEVQGVPPKLPYATLIHFLGMGVAGWGVTPRPKDKYFVGATSPSPPHSDPTRTLAYEILRIP
jgi:hypothetical protein